MEELLNLIGQFGLPVALVVWYTIFERPRLEKKYEAVVEKMLTTKNGHLNTCNDLIEKVDKLVDLLESEQAGSGPFI